NGPKAGAGLSWGGAGASTRSAGAAGVSAGTACWVRSRWNTIAASGSAWPRVITKYTRFAPTSRPARNTSASLSIAAPRDRGCRTRQRGALGQARSFAQDRTRARADRFGQRARAPVGHADAAVRLVVAGRRRLRGSVGAVVLLRQVDPDHAVRIVRSRRDLGLAVAPSRIPEQVRVVVAHRIVSHALELLLAY